MRHVLLASFFIGATLLAQGRNGRAGAGPVSPVDMTKIQMVEGTVSALNLAYGAQYPVLQLGKAQVKIAPVWFFLEKNFEIRVGDSLRVSAAPSVIPGDPYMYAIQIANTVTNSSIVLRDSSGLPLWTGGRGPGMRNGSGPGMGPAAAGDCINAATIATFTGVVESVSFGSGFQMPYLTVKAGDGTLVTVKIGPERILLEADVELKTGQNVTMRYVKSGCRDDELVALGITLADGRVIVLRHDDGRPAWD